MSDRPIGKNDRIRLTVTDLNNLGCGVGHLSGSGASDGMTVFVRGAVAGDEVEAKVIKVAKGYLVAIPETFVSYSPERIADGCPVSASCGGCVYQSVSYRHELERKRDYIRGTFRKAGMPEAEVEEVRTTGIFAQYRNKAQYPVGIDRQGKPVAGFYAPASHRVVPSTDCRLQPKIFGAITDRICRFAGERAIPVYDETTGRGLLRHIYLRRGAATGEILVCLVLNGDRFPGEEDLSRRLREEFPEIVGVLINENREQTNVILGSRYRTVWGRDEMEDELCGLRFRVSPGAFYQVNHDACELLYGIAKEKAGLTGQELLIDLYCGIGTIGLCMADRAREVVGVEIVPEAVECAKKNAERNGIANATFLCGDASDPEGLLKLAANGRESLAGATVILDPPRKGTTEALIRAIAEQGVPKVVYVSCNPDTLARDCVCFREAGYTVGPLTPVDLFPRTGHVETVVLLCRENQ